MRKLLIFVFLLALLGRPVQAAQADKYVALTFDDGPSGRFTQALLEGLAERNVHATFFLCGYRLETYGDLARQIRSRGHEIGLHGYSHDSMAAMSSTAIAEELQRTRALLPGDPLVNLLRTPGGQHTETIRQCALDAHLALVHWSLDPMDWATRDQALIYRRIMEQAADGDVILLHDMTDSTVQAALQAVDSLQAQGYRFLTVSQLAMLRLTHLSSGETFSAFPPAFSFPTCQSPEV